MLQSYLVGVGLYFVVRFSKEIISNRQVTMDYGRPKFNPRFKMPCPRNNYIQSRHGGPRPPHLLSESLLLPSFHQPPPMFGPRGTTIPPRFFNRQNNERTEDTRNDYWCETCDRGFRTQLILEDHKREHQRCNIDGCQFIAHPKVITKHIQMQHSSGLYKQISRLSDPQEIKKWREERRKKFPTKLNIDKKKAEVEEKIERGEKMSLKYNRFPDNINKNADNKRIHPFSAKNKACVARRKPKKNEKECPISSVKHCLHPFGGINHILFESEKDDVDNDAILDIEDEEFVADMENPGQSNSNVVCGAITQLIADYGSDDDDTTIGICSDTRRNAITSSSIISKTQIDETGSIPRTNVVSATKIENIPGQEQENIKVIQKDCQKNDDGPEEVKTIKSMEKEDCDIPVVCIGAQASKTRRNAQSSRISQVVRTNQYLKRRLPSTLLQKLLSSEIRRERNVTLQCIRYIIKHNYFDL